jgi:hypothetical protein
MARGLPRERITVSDHAHVRGWSRFDLDLSERKRALIGVLRRGKWYAHPDERDAFLVLGRVGRRGLCAIVKIEQGPAVVATVYPMTNAGQLDRFKAHKPSGPVDAGTVAQRYGLR